jgi:hypothetical protein
MLTQLSQQFLKLIKDNPVIKFKFRDFVKPELDKFRVECNFTDDELEYFEYKVKDKSNVYIAQHMHISEAQVSKIAVRVRLKIIRVV